MEASLVMFKADGQRREFPMRKSTIVVGRKNTCDLRIPLSSVSRQHFRVDLDDDDKLMLRDLGSSNGTFYNGERVLEAELGAGDQIRVGPVTFIVIVDGEPADIEPVKTVLPEDTGDVEESAEMAQAAAEVAAAASKPAAIEPAGEMPAPVEDESHTPTVDLDDDDEDPIAALEALAAAGGDDDDDDDMPIPFLDDDDDDDEDEDTK